MNRIITALLCVFCLTLLGFAQGVKLGPGTRISPGTQIGAVAAGCGTTAPCNSVLDTFTQGDGALSGSWTAPLNSGGASCAVVSSTMFCDGASAYWSATVFNANQEAFATWVEDVTKSLWLRVVNPNSGTMNGYQVYITDAGVWQLYRWDNNAFTGPIGSDLSQVVSAGDRVWIRADGTTISAHYAVGAGAFSLLGSWTESTYNNAGRIGASGILGSHFDNFGGGNR